MSTNFTEGSENTCVVCFKNVEIYSIGSCDHTVCYECSTRMRVLCRQNECPICRQDLPKVIFTCTVRPFNELQNGTFLQDKKFKICFENGKIQDSFYKLLEHSCSACPKHPLFRTFENLNEHMRREHELFYCDLCIKHLRIFTSERRCYTRSELAQHRRKGDSDDRSHRGHPLCQFCDIRFVDNDDLYRHLRRDHLYCHFCDADGFDLYYSLYDDLRDHFRKEHFLCEEGDCIDEEFTPVFRTEIDLKAHRASAHGRTLGKAAAKQARTLEFEFTLKPRPRQDGDRRGKQRLLHEPSFSGEEGAVGGTQEISMQPRGNSPALNPNEFPSLPSGPAPVMMVQPQQRGRSGGLTIHAVGRRNAPLAVTDENFPVLGLSADSTSQGTSVRLNINQDRSGSNSGRVGSVVAPRNVSIHVNHRANGEQNIRIRQDDFPALSSNKSQTVPAAKWVSVSNKKPASAPVPSKPKASSSDSDFPSLNSKFNANLNLKSNDPTKSNFVNIRASKDNKGEEKAVKKAISVMIPVRNSEWGEPSDASTNSLKSKTRKKKSKTSNSTDEKPDTVKKKEASKEPEKKSTANVTNLENNTNALSETSSNENKLGKPLPTAEDWFGESKKTKKQSIREDHSAFDNSFPVASKLTSDDFPSLMSNNNSGSNSNTNNNNNNNNNDNSYDVAKSDQDLFVRKLETKAPPGFGHLNGQCSTELKKPPPGFGIDLPCSNGLTFTNSSGQSFAISANFEYTPPSDFEKRNQNLVTKVNEILLNDENLWKFRQMSKLFRQDKLTAVEYYGHCVKSMGELGFQEIFPELLVLLPDINKQQELFQVYSRVSARNKGKKKLETCETCRQVLSNSDFKQHIAHHSLQRNFPVLSTEHWTK